jgi:putative inorganic carbon (HCO3(-)) transporter
MTLFKDWLAILPLFIPLYLLRFDVFGIPTTLFECMVGLTAVVGFALFVRPKSFKNWVKKHDFRSWRNPLWPILLFFVAATISMMIVPNVTPDVNGDLVESARIAQGIWKGWIVMPLVYFGMIYLIDKDEEWWLFTMRALAISGFMVSMYAIRQILFGTFDTWDLRASGPFESANYLSLYITPILLLTIINLFKDHDCTFCELIWWGLMITGMSVALWGSQSYAAFISFAVGAAFYFFFTPTVSVKKKRILFTAGVAAAALLITSQMDTPKFQQFIDVENRTSSSVRLEVYDISTELVKQNPFLGIGLGQFEVQYQVNAPIILGHAPYEWVMLHPHNLALAFWLNTGLLGLISIIWLVLLVIWKGLHSEKESLFNRWFHKAKKKAENPVYPLRLIAISMLVVILVHGLFDTPFFKNDLAYLWWLVLVMGL